MDQNQAIVLHRLSLKCDVRLRPPSSAIMLGAGGGGGRCSPAARPCRPPTHSSAVSRVSRLSPAMSAASVFPRRFQDGFQKRIGFSSCFHALSAAACYYCSFPRRPPVPSHGEPGAELL